jgi:hypothetical protein
LRAYQQVGLYFCTWVLMPYHILTLHFHFRLMDSDQCDLQRRWPCSYSP